MIRFEDFSFSYEGSEEPQLKNFDFTIEQGEFVLFCGASACGKTTAAKCINGLIPHFTPGKMSGDVWVNGKKVRDTPQYELAKQVGYVFQNPKTQFFNLDSDSELVSGMENLNIPRPEMKDRVKRVTEDLKIQNLLGKNVFDLSGGEKQILALASVYTVNPDIYVLDEPTANIDEEGMNRLKECLVRLKSMGKTSFLRTLCGLNKGKRSGVRFEGKEISWKKRRDLCAMTMQDVAHQLFSDSVWDEFSLLNCEATDEEIRISSCLLKL